MSRRAAFTPRSSKRGRQFGEIGHDEIGLIRSLSEWPLPPVNECRPHATGFRPDTVEGVVGNKQGARAIFAEDLLGLRVRLPVRLAIASFLHRNDMIEREADVWPGTLQIVAPPVRPNRQSESFGPEMLECSNDIRKRLQLLDFTDEPANLVLRIGDAAAVHNVRDGAMADLSVRRMPAIAKGVDHRVLEVCASPPGDK